jgi:hypothetical protein
MIKLPLPIVSLEALEGDQETRLIIVMDASSIKGAPSLRPSVEIVFKNGEGASDAFATKLRVAAKTVQAMIDAIPR